MNFKIESKTLNITNYPIVAKHFEIMAAKGWLIYKIVQGNLLIYKKIKPESLDFTIAPYEIETIFTKKTKKELEEFKTVCKNVGWNYVTQVFNLHIYYKAKGAQATPIQTDTEEEFKNIEEIGKKQIKTSYFQMALFLVIAWMQLKGIFSEVHWMKDGLTQIVAIVVVLYLLNEAIDIFILKKFLKTNKENIEMGDPIKYSDYKYIIGRVLSILYIVLLILFIIHISYTSTVLNSKIYLLALVPSIIGIALAVLYRIYIKPAKKSLNFKKITLIVVMILSAVISVFIVFANIDNLADVESKGNIDGLKVLSVNDFEEKNIEHNGYLIKNSSILVPLSYEYTSDADGDRFVRTEYSNVVNEGLAENLVARYLNQASSQSISIISDSIEMSFEEDYYPDFLASWGLKESDYQELSKLSKRDAVKRAKKIIKESYIKRDTENLWGLDEVYFLRDENEEIVIRDGKEVFYLQGVNLIKGKDFRDPEVIRIVKEKLGL